MTQKKETMSVPKPVVPGFVIDFYEANKHDIEGAIVALYEEYYTRRFSQRTTEFLLRNYVEASDTLGDPMLDYLHYEPNALTNLVLMQYGYNVKTN